VSPGPRLRPRGGGFTLLEVLVALALLASALVAVSDLVGNALRNHAYARDLSSATLLARGKLAELEMKFEDEGFRDGDQDEHGDFTDASRPEVKWEAKLVRPDPNLSADQLISVIAGGGADPKELMAKLMGGGALPGQAGGAAGTGGAAAGGGGPTTANPAMAAMGGLLQTQLTAFGETVKKSLRELQLTVSWPDGRLERSFTVTTHLLVLNPRAPGGARGNDPEVPPNLAGAGPIQGGQGTLDPNLNRAPGGQKPGTPTPGGTK
jgi:general secretion pathway protein I